MTPDQKEAKLAALIGSYRRVLVAFSGGVDSSYLAFTAQRVLGDAAEAVTAISPSVSQMQKQLAISFATEHGLNHSLIYTREMADPNYTSNPNNRCYFCKSELYSYLEQTRKDRGADVILDGSNTDDLRDYRPGRAAVVENEVATPLTDADLNKQEIRTLSRKWGLSSWELPSMPCLSSRFPYGVEITEEKLLQVDRSESFLRSLGFRSFRVRHHEEMARLEIDQTELPRILNVDMFSTIDQKLRSFGYRSVSLDLQGFRSGSLNDLVAIEED